MPKANLEDESTGGTVSVPIDRRISVQQIERIKRQPLRRSSSFGEAPFLSVNASVQEEILLSAEKGAGAAAATRWAILVLTGSVMFGNYFAFDLPASLNILLKDYMGQDYPTWQWTLNTMYSVYSFPNMFLPIIGGHLVDHYDQRKVILALSFIVCTGQTLVATGITFKNPLLMIFGRFLFGIGGECIAVSVSTIITSWFRGKELGFALGMNLCIARLGSVANSMLSPVIAKHFNSVVEAVWFGTITCYCSFFATILLVGIMSKSAVPTGFILDHASDNVGENSPLLRAESESSSTEQSAHHISLMCRGGVLYDILQLPSAFWLLCIYCISLYGAVIPFNATASDFLVSRWYHDNIEMAGVVMSIPDMVSFFVVPFFGFVVDAWGKRISWLLLCSVLLATCHFTMGLSTMSPIPSMIGLGLSYAIQGVVLWPSLAIAVQHKEQQIEDEERISFPNSRLPPVKLLGMAFGLSMAALNTALTIVPLISAQIRIIGKSFVPVELFYATLAIVGCIIGLVLLIIDHRMGNILQKVVVLDQNYSIIPHEDDALLEITSQGGRESPVQESYVDDDLDDDAVDIQSQRQETKSLASYFSNDQLNEPQVLGTTRFIKIVPTQPFDVQEEIYRHAKEFDADEISVE